MPLDDSYSEIEDLVLPRTSSRSLDLSLSTDPTDVGIEVVTGSVLIQGVAFREEITISPKSCAMRCKVYVTADDIPQVTLADASDAVQRPDGQDPGSPDFAPITVSVELSANRTLRYSGPLAVTLIGTGDPDSRVKIYTSTNMPPY